MHRQIDAMRSWAAPLVPNHLRAKIDPDDLVQDAWVKAHEAGATFEGRAEMEVAEYLRAALRSARAEAVRGFDRLKRRVGAEQHPGSSGSDPWGDIAADHTSPTEQARRNEQRERLTAALADLPEDQRRAIALHHLEHLSIGEAARLMGRSYASTAGLIRRGLEALRVRLVERIT